MLIDDANRQVLESWKSLDDGFRYKYKSDEVFHASTRRNATNGGFDIEPQDAKSYGVAGELVFRSGTYLVLYDPKLPEAEKYKGRLFDKQSIALITNRGSRWAAEERTPKTELNAVRFECFRPAMNWYAMLGFPWPDAFRNTGDSVVISKAEKRGEDVFVETTMRYPPAMRITEVMTREFIYRPLEGRLLPVEITFKVNGAVSQHLALVWATRKEIPILVKFTATSYVREPKSKKRLLNAVRTFEMDKDSFEWLSESATPEAWDELSAVREEHRIAGVTPPNHAAESITVPARYAVTLALATGLGTALMLTRAKTRSER